MIEQGSGEWLKQRCGRVTASRIADIMARTKSGPSASRATYMAQLIAERLTGSVTETFVTPAMQHGIEMEAEAASAYEFYASVALERVGFVDHPTIPMTGASPDRLVGADGLVEMKCPTTQTHIETLLGKSVPGKYVHQMMWQLDCTGRQWCDFVSYDPRLPEELRLFVKRVPRDEDAIGELRTAVTDFLSELEARIVMLRGFAEQERAA